jgi:5-methylcytosine-specific restriction endonuclease McrA
MSRISRKPCDKIRRGAKDRCGYRQSPQHLIPIPFEIEHILPKSKDGTSEEENLWLACRVCNSFKHAKTHAIDPLTNIEAEIFNPRKQAWSEHFEFSQDHTEILGKTACGRATVLSL